MGNVAAGAITRRHVMQAAGAAALGDTLLRSLVRAEETLPTLAPVAEFQPAGGYMVNTLALAPDGKSMLTVCEGNDATVWDVAERKPVKKLPADGVKGALFVGDSKRAITFSERNVSIWTIADAPVAATVTLGGEAVQAVAVTPDGRSMVVGQSDTMSLWNLASATPTKIHEGAGPSSDVRLTMSPDGKRLVSSNSWGTARMYDMPSLAEAADWSFWPYMGGVTFSADGRRILFGEKEQVTLIDVGSKEKVARIAGPTQSLFMAVALLRDGNTVVAGDNWFNGRCWFGSLAKGRFIVQSEPLTVSHVAIPPDQRHAYVGASGTIYTYDLAGLS